MSRNTDNDSMPLAEALSRLVTEAARSADRTKNQLYMLRKTTHPKIIAKIESKQADLLEARNVAIKALELLNGEPWTGSKKNR